MLNNCNESLFETVDGLQKFFFTLHYNFAARVYRMKMFLCVLLNIDQDRDK